MDQKAVSTVDPGADSTSRCNSTADGVPLSMDNAILSGGMHSKFRATSASSQQDRPLFRLSLTSNSLQSLQFSSAGAPGWNLHRCRHAFSSWNGSTKIQSHSQFEGYRATCSHRGWSPGGI